MRKLDGESLSRAGPDEQGLILNEEEKKFGTRDTKLFWSLGNGNGNGRMVLVIWERLREMHDTLEFDLTSDWTDTTIMKNVTREIEDLRA